MTLHKSIEAAREAFKSIDREATAMYDITFIADFKDYSAMATEAFSTLPTKPMTQDEVAQLILKSMLSTPPGGKVFDKIRDIVDTLRNAGCLYVEDTP